MTPRTRSSKAATNRIDDESIASNQSKIRAIIETVLSKDGITFETDLSKDDHLKKYISIYGELDVPTLTILKKPTKDFKNGTKLFNAQIETKPLTKWTADDCLNFRAATMGIKKGK